MRLGIAAVLALLVVSASASVRQGANGVWNPPAGSYCGTSGDKAMSLRFDFDATTQSANVTLASFGQAFPTCVGETWTFDPTTGCTVFPVMNRPLHSSPDCMVDQLQLVWITKFNLTFTAPTQSGAAPGMVLADNGYTMSLARC
uniref:Uncharacterized protein n=1 Tax=Neobodo designis TaxID=312471 RepID=A0A7S1MQB1_NEODS